MRKMRFACITGVRNVEVRERPLPSLGDDEVLVHQYGCNICTADYGQWLGKRSHQGFPMAGGHEGAGVVDAVGKSVKNLRVGDFVATFCMDVENVIIVCRENKVGVYRATGTMM